MIWDFLVQLAIWTVIAVVVYLLLYHALRALASRTHIEADNIVLRTVRLPLIVAIVAYGLVSALNKLNLPDWLDSLIRNTYVVVLIAAGTYLAWRIVKEVILRWLRHRAVETESRLDDLLVPLIGTLGPLAFFVGGMVAILQYLGVEVTVLAASIGVVGLVIGLAFQDALANLFSGIYLLIDPSFSEGDLIRLGGDSVYSVEKVGLRMTRLYDLSTHGLIFVPNTDMTKQHVTNITKPTIDMKVRMSVTMPCSTDPVLATQMLHDVVASHRNILGRPTDKLPAIKKRLARLVPADGERGATLFATITALEQWCDSDAGTTQAQDQLQAVRREMNERLGEAQAAMKRLPRVVRQHSAVDVLHRALAREEVEGALVEFDEGRMARIYRAFNLLKGHFSGPEIAPVEQAIARLGALDRAENELEAAMDRAEQTREAELDKLMATLVWTGDWVAEEQALAGREKEAARISLWVRNMAALYAETEVDETVDGLDHELSDIIGWLHELEAGGLTKEERARIRALFGGWGGMRMIEKRRVTELRRRITRWLEWKERDTLSEEDYARLYEMWDRRLRVLSRRLPDTSGEDEEALDSQLVSTRKWLRSINFREKLYEWKLPSVSLKSFEGEKLNYAVIFYIDDIRQQHFSREEYVKNGAMMDIYETCQREGVGDTTVTPA